MMHSFPLAFAPEGTYVIVEDVKAGHGIQRRMAELGIVKGSVLRVVRAGPGPVIIERVSSISRESSCRCFVGSLSNGFGRSWRLLISLGMALKVLVRVKEA